MRFLRSIELYLTAICTIACAQVQPSLGQGIKSTGQVAQRPAKTRVAALSVTKINDIGVTDTIGPAARGNAVVRAAILLDRLKLSPGVISSTYTDNLGKAIGAFQNNLGLTRTGTVDVATWAALNRAQGAEAASSPAGAQMANAAPGGANGLPANATSGQTTQAAPAALVKYVITMEDVAGPFTRIPRVSGRDAGERLMLDESRLKQLGYSSPLELLAEKFHCSEQLLMELNPQKGFRKAGEEIDVPNVVTPQPPGAARVVVDGQNKTVTAYDANGKLLASYPATIGSEHDPLPVGDWTITGIDWYPKFKYNPNLFWDSENKHPRATLPAGPNSPVGVVWIGLSKPHYGIHGTSAPANIGRTQSHGCIRLTNWDATELGKMVQKGTPAILQDGLPSANPK